MDPSLKYKLRSSLIVIIFVVFLVGLIRPWIYIGFRGIIGTCIYITDPLINPAAYTKLFHEMKLDRNSIDLLSAMMLFSSILYLITTFLVLTGLKDIGGLIVSGSLGIASGLIWIAMYNYLVSILTEPTLGLASLLIEITIWPYIPIALGVASIITYIFVKPE